MPDIQEIGEMIKTGNVKGLSQIFQTAGDWDTRETVVVAIQDMVQEKRTFDLAETIEAVRNIEKVCKAETQGGNYRTNCLKVAHNLLRQLFDPAMLMQDTKNKLLKHRALAKSLEKYRT